MVQIIKVLIWLSVRKIQTCFSYPGENYLPRKQATRKFPQTDLFIFLKLNISKIKLMSYII